MKIHIKDSIGTRKIVSLSSYDIEVYLREMKNRGLSRSTVHQARAVLTRACRLARRWSGNVLPNPVADSELPSWGIETKSTVRAPSVVEVQSLLNAAASFDLRYGAFLRLIVSTGMRRGEGCAIRWSDIDFEGSAVRIDESIVLAAGGAIVGPPKTLASIRTIAVDPQTTIVLRGLLEAQQLLAKQGGRPLDEYSFAFSFEPGGQVPPYPDTMSHTFATIRALAGVARDVHMHSLRHFQATAIDAVVSERQKQARLGWSSILMARHYTDAITEEDRRAANHVGAILEKQSGGS